MSEETKEIIFGIGLMVFWGWLVYALLVARAESRG